MDELDPSVAEATGTGKVSTDTVVSVENMDVDPSWSVVTYADGRTETLPTSQANALPKMPPPAPPPAPVAAGPDPGFQLTPEQQAMTSASPETTMTSGAPGGQPVPTPEELDPLQPAGPLPGTLTATAQPAGAPGAAPLSAAGAPGGDTSQTASVATTESTPAVDTQQNISQYRQGVEQTANALDEQAQGEQNAKITENQSLLQSNEARQKQLVDDAKLAAIHTDEARKALQAIEDTPIEEDFFKGSPGRQVGAWVALALSGFLQGATQGRNPALAQMMQALQHAQDRFVADQRADRTSKFNQRLKMLDDAKATEASIRMQIPALIEKHAQLEAQKLGLAELPPAVSTAAAQMRVGAAAKSAELGQFVQRRTEERFQAEQKAGQGDQVPSELAQIGVSDKAHQQAMDEHHGALGTKVQVADQMKSDLAKLEAIAARHSGELPGQTFMSWSRLGAAPALARAGLGSAQEQVQAQQILDRFILAAKQGGNVRLYDSDKENEAFIRAVNTGTPAETLAAIRDMTARAERNAVATASAYAPAHPREYLDYVRRTIGSGGAQPAAAGGSTGIRERVIIPGGDGNTGGGPAPSSPLAQSPPGSQPGSGANPASNPEMKLSTLQAIHSEATQAGMNGDAIARIIRFESGGKADAKNPSGATGLIQWMPQVFAGMAKPAGYEGVRHSDLPDLTAEEQVPLAIQYFKEKFAAAGINPAHADVGDYYLAVAAPGAMGKSDSTVIYPKGSAAWAQNPAWRPADGGDITVGSIKARARTF